MNPTFCSPGVPSQVEKGLFPGLHQLDPGPMEPIMKVDPGILVVICCILGGFSHPKIYDFSIFFPDHLGYTPENWRFKGTIKTNCTHLGPRICTLAAGWIARLRAGKVGSYIIVSSFFRGTLGRAFSKKSRMVVCLCF